MQTIIVDKLEELNNIQTQLSKYVEAKNEIDNEILLINRKDTRYGIVTRISFFYKVCSIFRPNNVASKYGDKLKTFNFLDEELDFLEVVQSHLSMKIQQLEARLLSELK